ncbi:Oidioi.mRNA.OKI2018_I69.PAR.g11644.t2.cds [Oikopleura dioica]|uniref:X-box-binding protein 1 n=1 Tax=Oikopleura dioica TaxID=34765 RepID=A0ABN7S0V6_OIKDI|nr:Oidioi.mRNA.OKI2018_I69.PAR.g11644.t2.cds [Oikopleura dioica]
MVIGKDSKSEQQEVMVPAPIIIKLPVGTKKLTAENMKQISNLQRVPAQQQQHFQSSPQCLSNGQGIPVIKLEDLETLQSLDHRDQEYDNRIAERTPIDELRAGKHSLPIWAEGLFDQTTPGQPRRRRKLTHLTAGEKILRRKLKNRVAAQNARDKKKTAYEDLKSDNDELRAMMEELRRTQQEQRAQIAELLRENKELKLRLGDGDSAIGSSSNSICSGSSPEERVG